MRRIISYIILVYALSALAPLSGGQFYGGRGYLHTNAALLLPPGALDLSFYARGYTTQIPATTSDIEGWTYLSNGTSALTATFGYTRKFELAFTQILYQDLNGTFKKIGDDVSILIPGDTYIRFKIGGWSVGEKGFFSLLPALRYRVGRYHDIHLEPYESDAVEPELTMIYSYYWKPLYPDEDKSLHFNVGYLNHNDHESPTSASQEVNYLVSFLYPFRILDFGCELYGTHFVKKPVITVLGREDWLYVTPMMRYKPFKGFQFTVGIDMLVLGYINTSVPTHKVNTNFPNYSKWRVSGRINFAPSTSFYISPTFVSSEESGVGRRTPSTARSSGNSGSGDFFNRQDLFRWAIEGQVGGVDAVNLDLEKLRQERMKAEAELKELKKRLESKQSGSKK
ncbi:MAG: hypothetical protein HQ568_10835 [Calditrichaeota bacterium]|nr:hypothetical protein [Calditrichota bacterium]